LIQTLKKESNLDDDFRAGFEQILQIVLKRIKNPDWVTFEDIFELEEDYNTYRQELAVLF
jgi:hypothetical protein